VPGASIRPFERDRDDVAVHALVQECLSEVEGYVAETLEVWRAQRITKQGWDPTLWLLLEDDEGLAGVALGEPWEGAVGYVAQLGVAPRARGRGHGRALLLALFDAFRRTGLKTAELSVHGSNRGAARLYESAGMRSSWEAERWEKALGRD
jgi:ribosomal protein S18 acetylase RimI-like enzyme